MDGTPQPNSIMWLMQPQQQQQHPSTSFNDVPARVVLASRVLSQMLEKESKRIAVNGIGMEEYEGNTLSKQEELARESAAMCLRNYFNGDLKPDLWETVLLNGRAAIVANMKRREGILLNCPECPGDCPDPNCTSCNGSGQVVLFPGPPKSVNEFGVDP